jgi:hypothetical protein
MWTAILFDPLVMSISVYHKDKLGSEDVRMTLLQDEFGRLKQLLRVHPLVDIQH